MNSDQSKQVEKYIEEGDYMSVLAKPCHRSFDLDNSKAEEFFESAKQHNAKKAIERYNAHKPKVGVNVPSKKRRVIITEMKYHMK